MVKTSFNNRTLNDEHVYGLKHELECPSPWKEPANLYLECQV